MTTNTTYTNLGLNDLSQRIADHEDLELHTFEHNNFNSHDIENDIDLENIFFHSINNNCLYYTDEQFNNTVKNENELSIIHFNSRSLYANFHNIKQNLG